jgi:dTDP-glucose pyrophosphorylase
MRPFKEHLIKSKTTIKEALKQLDELAEDATLFVVDEFDKLLGSITDGDIRRGLLKNINIENDIDEIIHSKPKYIRKGDYNIEKIIKYRQEFYKIIPILNEKDEIINIINFRFCLSYLPLDVVIMAGGRGQRLQPLTDNTPKPLLKLADKPIIEYNIDRLSKFGISKFWITINYLGEQIQNYFGCGTHKNISIEYIKETQALGTIGSAAMINNFGHDYVLITNSDLITNIDYEQFFNDFILNNADMSVLGIPYQVAIPYAILDTDNNKIKSFKEKPTYTYYANGGIYLMKKAMLSHIPKGIFFNSTDLIEKLIGMNYHVISYPFSGYWLDVGKHDDFEKAKKDVLNMEF